jgi:CubicO group peptidase (beta-lactamase class C family)
MIPAARLEAFLRRTGAPAVAAALVPATGEPAVLARGERIRGGGNPAEATDRWHIGSCMKAMTAVTVARFAERGELSWDTPIADLLDAAHPAWARITLAEVLTHLCGLPANPSADQMRAALADTTTPPPLQRARQAERALAAAPDRPGRFRYSNLGYVLAGAALERLTGNPFEEVLAAEVLRPLGITSAGFGPPAPGQPWGHAARRSLLGAAVGRGPAVDPAGASLALPPDNPVLLSPAGRLHLTLHDWAAFVRLFLDVPPTLVSRESLDRIVTRPPGAATEQGMGWWIPSRGPLLDRIAYCQQGSNTRWVATAVVSRDRSRAVLVTCNDGRTRMLSSTLRLAVGLLDHS